MFGIDTSWIALNRSQLYGLLVDHVLLALPAIIGTLVIAVPLGFAAHLLKVRAERKRVDDSTGWTAGKASAAGYSSIILFASILYGIPSLALFVVLPLVLGTSILSTWNVIIALLLYGIALQTRVVADAFDGRDRIAAEAATAIGYTKWGSFWKVDLPLAGPAILAGMRVVSASTLSLVSVGALIGVSSLGTLLTDGFLRGFPTQVLTGVVGILLLAVVFDALIIAVGRFLMPWQKEAGL